MGVSASKKALLLTGFVALFIFSQVQMNRLYKLPYPPIHRLITKNAGFQDAAFITTGFRALAADVAWIELLQNMGSYGHEDSATGRQFPFLKDDTLRVTRIDPYFVQAYLFGAATLAWLQSTNRPDEALDVLREGITYNPNYWQLRIYAAGIGYSKSNEMNKMVRMLEEAVQDPACPPTIKSVLANSYKVQKRYSEALLVWENVLSSEKDREYHDRAREEILNLRSLMN